MTLFALMLSHALRAKLLIVIEGLFILFVLVSFIYVAGYGAKQVRADRLFTSENAPLPIVMEPVVGWLFVVCVMGAIYLQLSLYALIVFSGIAGALLESRRTFSRQFGLDRVKPVKALSWGLLVFGAVMLVETPLIEASTWVLDALQLPHPEQESVETFRHYNRLSQILSFIVWAVLVSPMIEELFFRGFLLTFLKKYTSTWLAIFVSAGIFALAHFNLGGVVPLWFLGVALGAAYEHTGSIIVPVTIHACFNLATALSVLLDKGNPS